MGGNDSKPQWKLTQLGLVFFLLCSIPKLCNQKFGNDSLRLFFSMSGDAGRDAVVSNWRRTTDGGEVVRIWTIFSGEMEARSLCFALLSVFAPAKPDRDHSCSNMGVDDDRKIRSIDLR
ncbi:hypothetical protein MRB53_013712 [Persea americana]|uniref:Uncharacterized protein n=1 Tax=Persea americana TaxID=3435 RepID=A0ACC2K954_PERAE|nr:hypothetical protein MRB53_013712 [Persea americana]